MPKVADIVEAYGTRDGLTIRPVVATPDRPYTGPNKNLSLGLDLTYEFVRTYTRPELYGFRHARHAIRMYCHALYQWHRDGDTPEHADTAFERFLDRIGMQSFDCDTCRRAVIVHNALTDPCPHCGLEG